MAAPASIRPETRELVTEQILRVTGLNAQAFSGAQNPSTIYRLMVSNQPSIYPYYREVEEKDTAVAAALETRRLLVLARDAGIQAADPENGPARLYAEAAAAFLDAIPRWRFGLNELLDSPAYGFAVSEIFWAVDSGQIRAQKLIGRPQELFSFAELTLPQTGPLRLSTFPGGSGQPVPEEKFIVNTYKPRHGDRRGLPLLRRLFWPSWFKRNALRLDLGFLEKPAGTVAVQYPSGSDPEEQKKALAAAEAIVDEVAVAVPETFKVLEAVLTSARTREGKDYQALVDYFDAEMSRLILGQTLATRGAEQQRGTLALGQVHERLLWEFVRHDALDLEEAVNEQLLRPFLGWQFGAAALDRSLRPWWSIEKEPPKDISRALDQLAKAQAIGLQIAADEAYENAQLRKPEEGETVLAPASAFGGLLPPTRPEEEMPLEGRTE